MSERGVVRSRSTYRILTTGKHVLPTYLAFGDTPSDGLAAALGSDLLEDGRVATVYACVLVETPGGLVLIDTGVAGEGNDPAPLLTRLDELGISPSEISLVLLSHAHEDHLGGLLRDGAPVFTEAQHVLARDEWRFWQAGDETGGLPRELYLGMRQAALSYLNPLCEAGLLNLVTGEVAVQPGVRVLPAPGHTPGHMAVEVTTGAQVLLYLGDALLHETMVAHPTWTGLVDADAVATVATRRALLSRASASAAVVAGGHFRGTGRIEKTKRSYRWAAS